MIVFIFSVLIKTSSIDQILKNIKTAEIKIDNLLIVINGMDKNIGTLYRELNALNQSLADYRSRQSSGDLGYESDTSVSAKIAFPMFFNPFINANSNSEYYLITRIRSKEDEIRRAEEEKKEVRNNLERKRQEIDNLRDEKK